jgi:hypothetical protein
MPCHATAHLLQVHVGGVDRDLAHQPPIAVGLVRVDGGVLAAPQAEVRNFLVE